jgi:hypothetical protein
MVKRYDIEKKTDVATAETYFFARVYLSEFESLLGTFKETWPKGLAREVSSKFPLEENKGDFIRSISEKTITNGIGTFPVSEEELIDFYEELEKKSK